MFQLSRASLAIGVIDARLSGTMAEADHWFEIPTSDMQWWEELARLALHRMHVARG